MTAAAPRADEGAERPLPNVPVELLRVGMEVFGPAGSLGSVTHLEHVDNFEESAGDGRPGVNVSTDRMDFAIMAPYGYLCRARPASSGDGGAPSARDEGSPERSDDEAFIPHPEGYVSPIVQMMLDARRPAPSPVSEEGPQPLNLDAVQAQVDTWTRQFRPTPEAAADPMADALCIAEEAGEVCRAVLKRSHGKRPDVDWSAQLRDEVGDVVIGLLSLAANEGWSLADAVTERWAEVSQRGATPEQGEGPANG